MKTFWALLAVLLAIAGLARHPKPSRAASTGAPATSPRSTAGRMNVLLITIDTLRADHLGVYGYRRKTSPHIDALAAQGAVFEQAYTYWPKTRGSFVMMMTGLRPSQNGYSKNRPMIVGDNPTVASTLKDAGYATIAIVDNPNVAAKHGYDRGFERYRETWNDVPEPAAEMARTKLITKDGVAYLTKPPADRPFFLWLHYVNPHAPYTPPVPYNTMFMDASADSGPLLKPVRGSFYGGVNAQWEVPGKRLGYYVAQYDGEIATVDAEVGAVLDALASGPAAGNTLVLIGSDHGESLGEHDYYFDHGADVYDPCLRIPLIVRAPGAPAGVRTNALASTLDFFPTILDAVKVSYPRDPRGYDFAGRSLLPEIEGGTGKARATLVAQNEHHWTAQFDARWKTVAVPHATRAWTFSLFDRASDPEERNDLSRERPSALQPRRRDAELFLEGEERNRAITNRRIDPQPTGKAPSPQECEHLESIGYIDTPGCEK